MRPVKRGIPIYIPSSGVDPFADQIPRDLQAIALSGNMKQTRELVPSISFEKIYDKKKKEVTELIWRLLMTILKI